jgi:hypothetical protein
MKPAFVCVCSEKYLPQYNVLYASLKRHCPEVPVILYFGDEDEKHRPDIACDIFVPTGTWVKNTAYENPLYAYCSIRPRCVLNTFEMGFDEVFLVGADSEFFARPEECLNAFKDNNTAHGNGMFVTMYIHVPYEDPQTLYGNNLQVLENGQINADLIGFYAYPQTIQFLEWLDKVLKTGCVINGKEYVDQVWMSMCFSFIQSVKIIRHQGYNVAHYNMFQRNMRKIGVDWYVGNRDPLVMFHYAGFEKGNEEKISRHQNRYRAEGDILEFLKEYSRRI